MLMQDRVALVTGASRGIGAATAKLLAHHGAAVAVNYFKSEEAAKEVVAAIEKEGRRALVVGADVRDPEQVAQMVATVTSELGPVDTLVLNASMSFPVKPFVEFSWDEFSAKLNGELKAAFYPAKAVVPGMISLKKGAIVGISSTLARVPGEGFVAHCTAKSGLDSFLKSLALELGPHGIKVNTVAPGLTLTDATSRVPDAQKKAVAGLTPLRRNGLPEDVAGAVLFLAADETPFTTGTWVPVNGGVSMV